MNSLSTTLIIYEAILLVFSLWMAYTSRNNPIALLIVGVFMIAITTLLLGTFGLSEMFVAVSKGDVAASRIKANFLLPTLFLSFGIGAIGANLVASAITAKK